jgi:hypothetical protein
MSRFTDALDSWQALEGLPSAFASARDSIDALLRDRGLRATGADTATLALQRGAEASAALEGNAETSADHVLQAALRLNGELLALVPVIGRSPVQALARMHSLTGLGPDESLGRPRDAAVADQLQELGRALLDATGESGLVVAALAHAEIAALAPFGSANGLVARAVERLLLVARGVDPASALVPEAGHLALRAEYEQALRGYADGTSQGAGRWLAYAARAAMVAAETSPLASGGLG